MQTDIESADQRWKAGNVYASSCPTRLVLDRIADK
jgi:hypothetical protein